MQNLAFSFTYPSVFTENPSGIGSKHRTWDDNSARTQNVNITLPFVSLTVLLEDPEAGAVLPEQRPSILDSSKCFHAEQAAPPLSASYPTKVSVAAVVDQQLRPSSVPKSFSSVDPVIPKPSNAFSSKNDDQDESDDEEEVFHDSGDYFEPRTPVRESKKDPAGLSNFSSKHMSSLSPPKPINGTYKNPSCEQQSSNGSLTEGTNSMQRVAVAFFQAMSKLDFRKPLHNLRDDVASILPFDHIG